MLTTLYSFTGSDGSPQAPLVQGSDGSFYGTTGGNNGGTVFRISAEGVLTSLYSFTGGKDGANPNALAIGGDGSFYGTTYGGTPYDGVPFSFGTVFKISPTGTLTTLYSFTTGDDGSVPMARLLQGGDGSLYGTTSEGGTNGYGTVFKIGADEELTSLYSFTGGEDGSAPRGELVQGSDGELYGTTAGSGLYQPGSVFKISTNGTFSTLYSFPRKGGGGSQAGLVEGLDGYFYGTTLGGVFKISPTGAFTDLTGVEDGSYVFAALVQGSDGYLYGTASAGGDTNIVSYGAGTVFRTSTNGMLTTLYSFTGGSDGEAPMGALSRPRS
jgi:uncharacterized repeat protein (TIGR03803 family)